MNSREALTVFTIPVSVLVLIALLACRQGTSLFTPSPRMSTVVPTNVPTPVARPPVNPEPAHNEAQISTPKPTASLIEVSKPMSTVTSESTATQAFPRDVSRFDLFSGSGAAAYGRRPISSVEDVLEKGLPDIPHIGSLQAQRAAQTRW